MQCRQYTNIGSAICIHWIHRLQLGVYMGDSGMSFSLTRFPPSFHLTGIFLEFSGIKYIICFYKTVIIPREKFPNTSCS